MSNRRPTIFPFFELSVGEAFRFPAPQTKSVRALARICEQQAPGRRFRVSRGSLTVTRIL